MNYENHKLLFSAKVGNGIKQMTFKIDESFIPDNADPEGRLKPGVSIEVNGTALEFPLASGVSATAQTANEFRAKVPIERISVKKHPREIVFGVVGTLTVWFSDGTTGTFRRIAFARAKYEWWIGGAEDNGIFHCSANPQEECVVYYAEEENTAFTLQNSGWNKITIYKRFSINPWMGRIADDTCTLNTLAIPGTHNSATFKVAAIHVPTKKCQDTSIYHQLFLGIRFFDLRLYSNGNIGHDTASCGVNIEEILRWCQNFMEHYPTETIMLRICNADGHVIVSKMNEILNCPEFKNLFLRGGDTPMLKDAKGKILIFGNRNTLGDFGGVEWHTWRTDRIFSFSSGNTEYIVEDMFQEYDTNLKWEAVKSQIDAAMNQKNDKGNLLKFYITFNSIAYHFMGATGTHTPENYAWGGPGIKPAMNVILGQHLHNLSGKIPLGAILLDFCLNPGDVSIDVIDEIIKKNFE